ncbi:MAG: RNA polymerase sigma factor [Woeseiaceae bacterium]
MSIQIQSMSTVQSTIHQQFVTQLEQHAGIVLKVARTYCWHRDDRAELEQEIVMHVWRAYRKYDQAKSFSTWLYRIALNVAISHVRKQATRNRHFVAYDESIHEASDLDTPFDDDPRIEMLQRFMTTLEPLNRAVLLLYFEEHTDAEIANIVGIPETNVASKVSRLKQRIRTFSAAQEQRGPDRGTG